jgi:hypothetical protein
MLDRGCQQLPYHVAVRCVLESSPRVWVMQREA